MSQPVYDELTGLYRRGLHTTSIVVSHGAGLRYAATRWNYRSHGIQVRIWNKSAEKWHKWRKLQPAEIVRIATQIDLKFFKPQFGWAWERD